MYVVLHPTNHKGDAIDFFDNSTNIFKYPGEIFFPHGNASALGVENEVNVNFYVRVCHIMLFDDILFCRPYGTLDGILVVNIVDYNMLVFNHTIHTVGLHPYTVGLHPRLWSATSIGTLYYQ